MEPFEECVCVVNVILGLYYCQCIFRYYVMECVSWWCVLVPISLLYVWVYLVVEMGIYVFVGRAAICISEVSGLWWKVEGIGGV